MKKLAAGIFLLVFVAIVNGQEPDFKFIERKKTVLCSNTITVLNGIKSFFDEKVTWFSQNELMDNVTTIALLENKKTGSWTLLEFDNNTACVLASGENTK